VTGAWSSGAEASRTLGLPGETLTSWASRARPQPARAVSETPRTNLGLPRRPAQRPKARTSRHGGPGPVTRRKMRRGGTDCASAPLGPGRDERDPVLSARSSFATPRRFPCLSEPRLACRLIRRQGDIHNRRGSSNQGHLNIKIALPLGTRKTPSRPPWPVKKQRRRGHRRQRPGSSRRRARPPAGRRR
jgi:hypothetical protein